MLGTIRSRDGDDQIDTLMDQLRQRQLADEQKVTFANQREMAVEQKELEAAKAIAGNQAALTASKIAIEVQTNQAAAQLERQRKEAEGIKLTAAAEADATRAKGIAEADVIRAQAEASGGPLILMQMRIAETAADAIRNAKTPIVPNVVVGGTGGDNMASGLLQAFVANQIAKGSDAARTPPSE